MGRHGGINILHQKSWHVWRMDNRLQVERDELQHAAKEKEKRQAEQQASFDAKLGKLRKRARGAPEDDEDTKECTASSSTGLSQPLAEDRSVATKEAPRNEYRFGSVTLSNLKQAEHHLDMILKGSTSLKGKGKGKRKGKPDDASSNFSLGRGPHINLFQEAEDVNSNHTTEHEKQLRYTMTNNDLAGKSKQAMLSEFDEIESVVPWYVQPKQTSKQVFDNGQGSFHSTLMLNPALVGDSGCDGPRMLRDASRSRSRSPPPTRVRKKRHGQTIIYIKEDATEANISEGCEDDPKTDDVDVKSFERGSLLSGLVVTTCKREKKNKQKKEKKLKKHKSTDKEDDKRLELVRLRQEREHREKNERVRSERLLREGVCTR